MREAVLLPEVLLPLPVVPQAEALQVRMPVSVMLLQALLQAEVLQVQVLLQAQVQPEVQTVRKALLKELPEALPEVLLGAAPTGLVATAARESHPSDPELSPPFPARAFQSP